MFSSRFMLFPTLKKKLCQKSFGGGGGGVHQVMGVCCIVFGIDGMLFEFFMNFFNIEKYKKKFFMFSSRFMLFPTFKKNNCVNKISGGGGGC